jgi:hypothetical protein
MSKRYDVVSSRPGKEKNYSHKVGTMFVNDEGRTSIKLDSLPLPNEKGEVWLNVYEARPREDRAPARQSQDDEIPW